MTLSEKLAEAMNILAEVKEEVEAGEKPAEELEEAIKNVEELKAKIKAAGEAEMLIKSLGEPERKTETEGEKKMAKTIGEHFVESIKAANVANRFDVLAPAFKANTDVQKTPAGAAGFATTYDYNLVEVARTPLVIRDLFAAETISGSTLTYLVEGKMEGTIGEVAEGTAKKQVHFADPTPTTVSLSKIACYIKESSEYITDYPFLESAINGRLLYELQLAEQAELVKKLTATSGIQKDESTWTEKADMTAIAELILKAAMDVQDGSGFAADAIVMNPGMWYALRVKKDTTGQYYGGGFFGAQNVPNLWGIPVCVTTAVKADEVIVGAFKTCGSVVTNGGISVEAVNTNEDDFIKNLMTIRAEERLALAVRRPAGFKYIKKQASEAA